MIFGASTRAAAQSAVRAGLRPICADCFADEDLREIALVLPLVDYPDGLRKIVADSEQLPWMYTGSLENRPALLKDLATVRPLLGNPADVVRAVRNPFRLSGVLRKAELPALEVRQTNSPPPPDGRWMLKPCRGSAGHGIHLWQAGAPALDDLGERCYFQQRAGGRPISALFLSRGGTTTLIGVSEQLIGVAALWAGPFVYCGSIGPLALTGGARRQVNRTGETIASAFGLRGLFGVDFVLDHEIAWPTEVNPRYTASVEVYEWCWDLPLLAWHCGACRAVESPAASRHVSEEFQAALGEAAYKRAARQAAKAVVYAPFGLRAPDLVALEGSRDFLDQGVEIADRPKPGFPIAEKTPVCTLIIRRGAPIGLAAFEGSLRALSAQFERHRIDR